eukprot:1270274-Pyramimonas_sp.AAC.1
MRPAGLPRLSSGPRAPPGRRGARLWPPAGGRPRSHGGQAQRRGAPPRLRPQRSSAETGRGPPRRSSDARLQPLQDEGALHSAAASWPAGGARQLLLHQRSRCHMAPYSARCLATAAC